MPEYYLTRAELTALRLNMLEIIGNLGRDIMLIEPGVGAGIKVRLLLERRGVVGAYVPVDICKPALRQATAALAASYPHIEMHEVCADFTQPFSIPESMSRAGRRVVFFPGSTIGNCTPPETVSLLRRFRELVGADGGVLLGIDLCKPPAILVPAYNDSAGVTASFNLNLLYRLNRECGAHFIPERFSHQATWNEAQHRIEMRLISRRAQRVPFGPVSIRFEAGESILTEYSHKPTREEFAQLAKDAGFQVAGLWTDPRKLFAVHYLQPLAG